MQNPIQRALPQYQRLLQVQFPERMPQVLVEHDRPGFVFVGTRSELLQAAGVLPATVGGVPIYYQLKE